jgi:hypothetical protein
MLILLDPADFGDLQKFLAEDVDVTGIVRVLPKSQARRMRGEACLRASARTLSCPAQRATGCLAQRVHHGHQADGSGTGDGPAKARASFADIPASAAASEGSR